MSKINPDSNIRLSKNNLKSSKPIENDSNISDNMHRALNVFDRLDKKALLGCVMNYENLLENASYNAYSCEACPDKMDFICQFCFLNCHKGHDLKSKGSNSKVRTVLLRNNACKCALKDHEFKNPNAMNNNLMNKQNVSQNICSLNEVFSHLKPDFYYYEQNKKEFFCFFCVENCMLPSIPDENKEDLPNQKKKNSINEINFLNKSDNNNNKSKTNEPSNNTKSKYLDQLMKESKNANTITKDKLVKIPAGNIRNIPSCCCKATEAHEPSYENANCLIEAFSVKEIASNVNISKLPGLILSKNVYEKYLEPLISVLNSKFQHDNREMGNIEDNFNSNNNNNLNSSSNYSRQISKVGSNNYKSEQSSIYESKVFKSAIELLLQVSSMYTKGFNPHLNYNNNLEIFRFFTFDYIIKVFEDDEITSDMLYLKTDLLKIFRNLTLKPIIKFRNMSYVEDYSNTSVLHRLILGKKFPLENSLKKNFFRLTKIINITLHKASAEFKEHESFIYLVSEFIKILLLIIPFNDVFLSNDPVEFNIDSHSRTYNVQYVEDNFNNNNNQEGLNKENQFNSNVGRQNYNYEHKMNILIQNIGEYVNNIKCRTKGFKTLVRNWEKLFTKILLLKNDYIFFRQIFIQDFEKDNQYNEMKFSFQNDRFNEKVFKLLFSIDTLSANSLSSTSNNKFYDMIVNKNDFYINKLKNFCQSNFEFIDSDFLTVIDHKYAYIGSEINNHNPTKLSGESRHTENYSRFTEGQFSSEKIKFVENKLKEIDILMNEYYLNKISDKEYLSLLKNNFAEMESYIKRTVLISSVMTGKQRNNNLSEEELRKYQLINFRSQICLFKLDLFNVLVFTFISLKSLNFLQTSEELTSARDNVISYILNILDSLCYDNLLISELFFNKFLSQYFVNYQQFYLARLKTLKKFNYKLNLEDYTNVLIEANKYYDWYSDIDKTCLVLQIYFNILKISCEKTSFRSNSLLYEEFLKMLNMKEYEAELNAILTHFTNKAKEISSIGIANYMADRNAIPSNNNNSISISNENNNISDFPKNFLTIKHLLKGIYYLKPEYFYLISNSIQIALIKNIINIDFTLHPIFRKVFVDIYFRFHCESYFTVKQELNREMLNDMKNNIDCNLIIKMAIRPAIIDYASNKIKSKKSQKVKMNNIAVEDVYTPKELEEQGENHPKILLSPIIYNLEIFKLMFYYHEDKIKLTIKKAIKFFSHIALKPVIFSIHKIIYFSRNISAEMKYIIYKLIYLFLECYKYFLELLKKFQNLKTLNSFFYMPVFHEDEEVISFINDIYKKLESDIKFVNSENFEQLNFNAIMTILVKYFNDFNFYRQLAKDKEFSQTYEFNNNPNINNIGGNVNQQGAGNNKTAFNDVSKSNNNDNINLNPIVNDKLNTSNNLKENLLEENKGFSGLSNNLPRNLNLENSSKEFNKNSKLFDYDKFIAFKTDVNTFIYFYESLKENFFEDNILKKIFSEEINHHLNLPNYKLTIAEDLLSKFDFANETFGNPINENNTVLLESVIKLFKTDPHTWQDIMIEKIQDYKIIIFNIIEKQLPFLIQYILIEFNKLNTDKNAWYYDLFINLIEFFRLLCEDHHKIFQTILLNCPINDSDQDYSHFNFILKIPVICLEYLSYYRSKKEFLVFFKETNSNFFDKLVDKLTEYKIELIQGSLSKNFDRLAVRQEFTEYYELHYKFFDFLEDNKIYDKILANFINFLNCYIEENSNSIQNKSDLVKKLNPKKLYAVSISCFIELFKNLYDIKEPKATFQIKNFETTLQKMFLDAYLVNKNDLFEQPEFHISFGIFKYFKRVSTFKSLGEKTIKVLEGFKKSNPVIFELFNVIIRDVEIIFKLENSVDKETLSKFKEIFEKPILVKIYEDLETSEDKDKYLLDKVIFLIHKNSIFQTKRDIDDFIAIAPYDNFNTKLNFLLEYFPTLNNNIELRKVLQQKNSEILNYLYHINYGNLVMISAFVSTITCLILAFSLHYDENMNLHFPGRVWVYSISILHLTFLLFFIINWFGFNIYKLYAVQNSGEAGISFFSQVFSLFFKEDIFLLLWNFFFGFLALLDEKMNFLFALQLFSIFNIFPTMSSVIYAVRIRYKQFLSTAFLLLILILFYSAISYFYFRDELFNDELKENICESLLQCFLYLINSGIRSGSGIEFNVKQIEDRGYFKEFFFGWMFYFIIMLIIVNIVNGIIVDTFQALREQNNLKDDILYNFCYICSLQRGDFEVKGINYEKHINEDHYIKNYFDYLIKLQGTDEHDLNSLDSQVLQSIKEFKTDFFPNKRAKALESE